MLERLGLQEIKHFQHRSQGSIREVFLFLEKAIKDKVIKAAASSEVFGCLADEVTDISVLQQFVVFVKYVNTSGMPQTDFLHTGHMTDAATGQELTQTRSHKFIGTLYILKEIITHLAVLSKTLQHGELCFPGLPSAVSYCLAKLDDVLKRNDEIHRTLNVDLSENGKLALAGIEVTPASTMFLNDLITSYVAKLKENIAARFPSLPLVQAFSIFDLQVLPVKEAPDFKIYSMNHIATLSDHFVAT